MLKELRKISKVSFKKKMNLLHIVKSSRIGRLTKEKDEGVSDFVSYFMEGDI